jgi:two-component system nitrogen regulation sensor histidine kinase GlnL
MMQDSLHNSAYMHDCYAAMVPASLPHCLIMLGGSNKIVYANDAAQTFFQTSKNFLLKHSLDYFIAESAPLLSLVNQARQAGRPFNAYRLKISNPALNFDHIVDAYISPVSGQKDIITVMLLEQSLAEKIDRQMTYKGAVRTVSGLSAMLAHEIKNPLSGIRGAAQILEGSVSEEDRELTELIRNETDRIVKLVDSMEVFTDERPAKHLPVNIHTVLTQVKKLAQNGFGQQCCFQELYDPSIPDIHGNRDQLIQAVLNLVKNACEAIKNQSKQEIILKTSYRPGVQLTIASTGRKIKLPIEICIMDNGDGISDDILPHLYDPFVTTKTNGSGLGLALVAKIIRDHGGTIEFERAGEMSVFRIMLPLDPSQNHNRTHAP